MTDSRGVITLARTHDPYGTITATSGPSASGYAFTSEYRDSYLHEGGYIQRRSR